MKGERCEGGGEVNTRRGRIEIERWSSYEIAEESCGVKERKERLRSGTRKRFLSIANERNCRAIDNLYSGIRVNFKVLRQTGGGSRGEGERKGCEVG